MLNKLIGYKDLLCVQLVLTVLVYSKFIFGGYSFAYMDIGSDSYGQVVAYSKGMIREFQREGYTGWTFLSGLGGPTALWMSDVFVLLGLAGGVENVLSLRIWVYVLKMLLGGAVFYSLIKATVKNAGIAAICGLSYSFCGYFVINGQWDSEGSAYVVYPLVLLGIYLTKSGNRWLLPVATAFALVSGAFFVALAVFFATIFLLEYAVGGFNASIFRRWCVIVVPGALVGGLMASPALVPIIFQLADTSRVNGVDGLFARLIAETLSINDWKLIVIELGSFFHKDLFGIGSAYAGYWNYLEAPGFYIAMPMLLLQSQLILGNDNQRRLLGVACLAMVFYLVFPVFRYLPFGFAVPYFRVSTLWVTMLMLYLSAHALDVIRCNGLHVPSLLYSTLAWSLVLGSVKLIGGDVVSTAHLLKVYGLIAVATVGLILGKRMQVSQVQLHRALLFFILVEVVLICRPSYVEGRKVVSDEFTGFDDGTAALVANIKAEDKDFYRIEKDFTSVSLAESWAQDYMGVKSYGLHSRGMVDFFAGTSLLPNAQDDRGVNYTNWIPNAGDRFALNSFLGVKYILSRDDRKEILGAQVHKTMGGLYALKNEYALPLGFVQTKQILRKDYEKITTSFAYDASVIKDLVLMNAVVLDEYIPAHGLVFDAAELTQSKVIYIDRYYTEPAEVLQRTGLRVSQYSSGYISGEINPSSPGVLVFTIPFSDGWEIWVNGVRSTLFRADFGLLASTVGAGPQEVIIRFSAPGRRLGVLLGLVGLILLIVFSLYGRKFPSLKN